MRPVPTAVLVEGESDRIALGTLAARLGRDLAAEAVDIVAMDGITNTRTFARRYGPMGRAVRIAGLFDAPEEQRLRIGLAQAGMPEAIAGTLESIGFFRCALDLEDELIRALGAEGVEAVIAVAGESARSRASRRCPRSATGRARRCCCASSARNLAGRRSTPGCSSRHSISAAPRHRSWRCSRTCSRSRSVARARPPEWRAST